MYIYGSDLCCFKFTFLSLTCFLLSYLFLFTLFTSENLLVYPPEDVIYGDYSFKVWDDNMIKYVLGFFTPDNMRTDVISKKLHSTQSILLPFSFKNGNAQFFSVFCMIH